MPGRCPPPRPILRARQARPSQVRFGRSMSWVNVSLAAALAAARADSTSVTLRYGTTPPRHVRRRPRPELAVAIALADLGLASLPSPIDVLVAFDLVSRRLQLLSLRLVQ